MSGCDRELARSLGHGAVTAQALAKSSTVSLIHIWRMCWIECP